MDSNIFFSDSVNIKIQGLRVLRMLSQTPNSVVFTIIGFEDIIKIIDYRQSSICSVNESFRYNNPRVITQQFNQPADMSITSLDSRRLYVSLGNPHKENPEYMLWINVGLKGSMPIYDYIYHQIIPYGEEGEFALFALFKRNAFGRSVLSIPAALEDKIYPAPDSSFDEDDFALSSYSYEKGLRFF